MDLKELVGGGLAGWKGLGGSEAERGLNLVKYAFFVASSSESPKLKVNERFGLMVIIES